MILDNSSSPAHSGIKGRTALHAAVILNDQGMIRHCLKTQRTSFWYSLKLLFSVLQVFFFEKKTKGNLVCFQCLPCFSDQKTVFKNCNQTGPMFLSLNPLNFDWILLWMVRKKKYNIDGIKRGPRKKIQC